MAYIVVDIESDGPIPGDYSMVSFAAVLVTGELDKTFYGKLKPISSKFEPDALAISGFTREETMGFDDPQKIMTEFAEWVKNISVEKPIFVSDNNGFDWMFMCWYLHHFTGGNPFGYSSQNLGSLYKGMIKSMAKSLKHLRKTKHTNHPLDDAKGNAEALMELQKMGLGIKFN